MALKRTTVMLDEDDLALIKAASAREGRPEAEYIRDAVHRAALRTRTWDEDLDIPSFDFGEPMTADGIKREIADEMNARHR
ncbi:CopG family transcriptional regulator [Tsukamurella sp. NPDC003166]|uniref:ribbon-helix-helix domain-containing protein n=1 Tax=Tsukamurella sp. NPDC003166 TaxID=3154444 RepID=UPI0033B2D6F7